MKKYLFIGLIILVGTNLVVLGGVAFNRMGDTTAQLTLTERELSFPYYSGAHKENSGISLSIKWRTPTQKNEIYSPYHSKSINITKDELLALGFDKSDVKDNYWVESQELYLALEFDGALHKAEIKKASEEYQTQLATFEEQDKNINNRKMEFKKNLQREKTSNSRLFFKEASANYESLEAKFAGQKNILIVKGLGKPYYNSNERSYKLQLQHLLVRNIMIPLEYSDVFSSLERLDRQDITPPRYSVDLNWGKRLEPWVVDVKEEPRIMP
jgi:hypothetical protein